MYTLFFTLYKEDSAMKFITQTLSWWFGRGRASFMYGFFVNFSTMIDHASSQVPESCFQQDRQLLKDFLDLECNRHPKSNQSSILPILTSGLNDIWIIRMFQSNCLQYLHYSGQTDKAFTDFNLPTTEIFLTKNHVQWLKRFISVSKSGPQKLMAAVNLRARIPARVTLLGAWSLLVARNLLDINLSW